MHLTDPLGSRSLLKLVRHLGGVHAQVASAAELQCAVRLDGLAPGAVERALKQRRIVKTWLMRGTLHYIASDDLPAWTAAAEASYHHWRKPAWQRYTGLSTKDVEQAVEWIDEALDTDEPMTREELADSIAAKHSNRKLDEFMRSGWGSILKIASWHGSVCFGPNRGRNVTFIKPQRWLDGWSDADPDDALRLICLRYLASHGPATREEFARWWGFFPPQAGKVIASLGDEVVQIDRAGDKAFVPAGELDELLGAEEDSTLRMLGMFDAYTLAGLPHDSIVPKSRKDEVYRKGAWVSQVVTKGGRVVGTWTHDSKPNGTTVEVTTFAPRTVSKPKVTPALEPLEPFLGKVTSVSVE
jgi:hypothetical protein